MKYELKKINIDATDEKLEFPNLKDRIIEKQGYVITFTVNELENNIAEVETHRKEQEGMFTHRNAIVENIEHYHKFIKKLTPEQVHVVWAYKDAKTSRDVFQKNMEKCEVQLQEDKEELAEVLKQIPELAVIPSAEVVEGELQIEGDK